MRKKTWKILGAVVGLLIVLLLLFTTAFVFNPFEGSLPDIRGVVPRDIDWFARKSDLRDDFSSFPEPVFWEEFEISRAWQVLHQTDTYKEIEASAGLDRAFLDLAVAADQIREQSGGFVDLVDDVIGNEVVVAGFLRPPALANASYCAYLRVSWKLRAAWGLLEWDSVRQGLVDGGLAIAPVGDGTMTLTPANGGPPIYLGRHLDCLMVSNDQQLLKDSLELASGVTDLESFATTSYYRDEIGGRLAAWKERTQIDPNAVELFVRPEQLLEVSGIGTSWPDPRHPTDMSQRVLASFLKLSGWRFLSSSLIFEPDPQPSGSMTLLANLGLNRNEHSAFQANFFKAEAQDRQKWLNPFLSMVPQSAVAAAALRVPAADFLHEMFRAVEPELRRTIDEQLQRTGQYDSVSALIDDLAPALLPRLGVVFRRAREIGGDITSFEPSPAPHVAWVFWVDPRFRQQVQQLFAFLTRHSATLGFDKAYDLPVDGGAGGDAAREFVNPNIPGTGEIAVLIYGDFFVFSNSGPLIREMIGARIGGQNLLGLPDYKTFEQELAPKLNGFVYLQGPQLIEIAEDYIGFLESDTTNIDSGWAFENRPRVERDVLRRSFPAASSAASLSPAQRQQFENEVDEVLQREWQQVRDTVVASSRGGLDRTRGLGMLFRSAYLQVDLAPNAMQVEGRVLFDYIR